MIRQSSEFATLVSAHFVKHEEELDAPPAPPTIPFDYLSVADELCDGRIQVAETAATALYRDAGGLEAELEDLIEHTIIEPDTETQNSAESLLSVDPDDIECELNLSSAHPRDLAQLRRMFAQKNHPDAVAPHLRDRALIRMQLANQLIDAAQRKEWATAKV